MKKLEIIIRPEKLEDLKAILEESNVNGLNIANIMGYGNQKGVVKRYRGAEYRESAVYRITGVLSVIGGWFITAFVASLMPLVILLTEDLK